MEFVVGVTHSPVIALLAQNSVTAAAAVVPLLLFAVASWAFASVQNKEMNVKTVKVINETFFHDTLLC